MKIFLALLASFLVVAATAAAPSGNMNGLYKVASGAKQDVEFNTDYASKGHKYFDVHVRAIAVCYM